MAISRLEGTFTALISPFLDGALDERALRSLVERQIAEGVSGLVPCGTTGETPTLTGVEYDRVVRITIEQTAGRVPVVVGTGGNDTRATIARTRAAQAAGADAALIVTPYYNKPTQHGLYAHFAAVADACDLPIVLYNVPGRTGVNLLPETVLRLAELAPVIAVKEASGNLDQASELAAGTAGFGFSILSGDDSLTLPIMSVGGRGVVSVVANILPGAVSRMTGAALAGDYETARGIHLDLFDLCRAMFVETNPVPVKTAAGLLGLCSPEVRLPLASLSPAAFERVAAAVRTCRFTQISEAA
jgi:4-hydroxy-tetrahydrodipicolinate synthase